MTVTINGTTGIDKVAAGAIEKADLPAGTVLQVVNAVLTSAQATTSASYVDITGLTATITPSSSSNKVLVRVCVNNLSVSDANLAVFNLLRNGTTVTSNTSGGTADTNDAFVATGGGGTNDNPRKFTSAAIDVLDSPNSISALTYKVQMAVTGGATGTINRWQLNNDAASVSTITLMEIAA